MSLRFRLIVAFFLLSVVPMAAVTLYTYTSNVEAMRDAAGRESELLADELTQRMQVVTAQLGQRVERLMNMSAQATAAAVPVASAAVTPPSIGTEAANGTTAAAAPTAALGTQQVANALGDMAMFLNNVELHGLRGRGRRGGGGSGGNRGGGPPRGNFGPPSPSAPPVPPQAPTAASGVAAPTPPSAPDVPPGEQAGAGDAANGSARDGANGRSGDRFRGGEFRGGPPPDEGSARGTGTDDSPRPRRFPPGTPRLGPPNPPEAEDASTDPTHIRIDMAPIWGDVLRQFVPDGRLDQLSAEERQRVFAEVGQRMLGIQQGIKLLQTTVAERAADAKAQAPATTAVPARPAPTAAAPKAPTAPAAPARAAITQRHTALTGSRLDVQVEQNGEVVGQANAEINLPNLLATVFTSTRRDRGEVPFAVGKDGHLYTPTAADKQAIESLNSSASRPGTAPGTTVLPEWIVVTTADPTGSGVKFGIARPVGEALAELQRTTARNVGFGLGFIGLALIGIVPLSSRLTRNLSKLSDGVRRIAQGEYDARVEVHTNDEVGRLAKAFNQMAADVEVHQRLSLEQERIRRELELGRQIQHDMLPQAPLRLGLTEIKGVSVPAREVGGDFFNYFQLANGTVALLVGDVSGKGVGAALLMANIQASLRTRLALGQDLAALARELDRDIEGSTPEPVYSTLFVGIFDPATRLLRCVNAGHNPQYVLRQGGGLERMESTGLPIGLLAGRGYSEQRMQLAAGDLLFFYTDGCVEAENPAGEMFGPERLEAALVAGIGQTADLMLAHLEAAVSRFRAGQELADDATMMVVKVG
jgi:serine phosphatase RsbU (regulator of sigma subunit)